ncbi:KpsF/GutQ family sugar-phosphate isomerase [Novosphingobium aureum]|uniref:KpsF/GutQ family sugar-phosphate isomerase n=1 Tax=Novosphingobium aureum TaxID=2792964 RepID=UPI001E3EB26F|nr:KpsF/GutQ family sugar-phosphate isomerase [Novosphingobium aureum]
MTQLARGLDATFAKACRLLAGTRGRIVVSGMGKSGHVGRKIAATLSATGSPAIYVNPAEAAHGDLGMIVPGDRLLVLSNSGNTPELRILLDHARGHDIDIVGVTADKTSLLARRATVTILVPKVAEACPQGLAPTSSSTQQLSLGDALAMALLDGRAGGGDKIGKLHPGGMIGLRRKRVGELMHGPQGLPLVHGEQAMESVISSMTSSGFGIAGVVDAAGQLLGTITDGDLRRHFAALGTLRAGDVMTASPRVLHVDMTAEEALAFLNHCRITCAFVMPAKPCAVHDQAGTGPANAGGKPLGVIHMHDFVRLGLS